MDQRTISIFAVEEKFCDQKGDCEASVTFPIEEVEEVEGFEEADGPVCAWTGGTEDKLEDMKILCV